MSERRNTNGIWITNGLIVAVCLVVGAFWLRSEDKLSPGWFVFVLLMAVSAALGGMGLRLIIAVAKEWLKKWGSRRIL